MAMGAWGAQRLLCGLCDFPGQAGVRGETKLSLSKISEMSSSLVSCQE